MSKITVNLTNYKDRSGARVAPGRYRVQVEDVELRESKGAATNGATMITVFLRVMGGEYEGSTLIDNLIVHDKTMFRVVGFLQGIGMPTPKKKIQINTQRFVGKTVDVDVDDGEPYNGRVKSEVRGYNRVPKSETVDDDVDDIEESEDDSADYDEEPEPKKTSKKRSSKKAQESDDDEDLDPWEGSEEALDLDEVNI